MSTDTWYCPRCGRDGISPNYSQRAHARHCVPPKPTPVPVGSPSQRYYWRFQLWRAGRLSASEALVIRMAYAEAMYRLEVAA